MHVHLMKADDWTVLYVDGKRQIEGHSLRLRDVIEVLCPDAELTSSWHGPDAEYLGRYGKSAPDELPEKYTL